MSTTGSVAFRIPQEMKARLERLSASTGRTEAQFIREALLAHFDEIEDSALAAESIRLHLMGDEPSITLDELRRELGV